MIENGMKNQLKLAEIRALVIDADGTLWAGKNPLPGLKTFFEFLRTRNISFIIATNNSVATPQQYQQKLESFGVQVSAEDILTCSLATATYLRREFGNGGKAYVIGQTGLITALTEGGFTILKDASQPADFVVVGGDSSLTYDKLKYATLLIQRGARLIGTNPDVVYPTEEGLVPEAGTTLAALQAATGVKPIVMGKPERYLFDMAVEKMGVKPEQAAMIGDRLETDIHGARCAGLKTILVMTGIDDETTILVKGIWPDMVVKDLMELVERWEAEIIRV